MTAPATAAPADKAPLHPNVYLPPATEDPALHAELHDRPFGTSALTAWAAKILIETHCPEHESVALIQPAPTDPALLEADGAAPGAPLVRRFRHRHQPGTGTVLEPAGTEDSGPGSVTGSCALAIAVVRRDTPEPGSEPAPGEALDADWITRADQLLATAARTLHRGALLAVPVPDPVPGAGFFDPSGYLIATAQSLGLRYHQHLIFLDALPDPAPLETPLDELPGESTTHERTHHDVLLFIRPTIETSA